ncbi:hypothetical protein HDU84_001467 [Entophlyctis sp. JEL0112]|nr:hypothetical protein HDU84_001467 [Entophlyctis sp. JEL0112]
MPNMVLRKLNTTHPAYEDATVDLGVRIDGDRVNMREYPSPDGDVEKTFVEAILNCQYQVNFNVHAPSRPSETVEKAGTLLLKCVILVDGAISTRIYIASGWGVVDGTRENGFSSRFAFAAPSIVEDGGIINSECIDKLGTIQIKMWVVEKQLMPPQSIRGKRNRSSSKLEYTQSPINERAKKGVFVSTTTRLSTPTQLPPRRQHGASSIYCKVPVSEGPVLTHTFHYSTRDFLEVDGILTKKELTASRQGVQETMDDYSRKSKCEWEVREGSAVDFKQTTISGVIDLTGTDTDTPLAHLALKNVRMSQVEVIDLT